MNIAIIDLHNLIIRYQSFMDQDIEEDPETALQIFNKIVDIAKDYDLVILSSDEGGNARGRALTGGEYKANRVKTGKHTKGFINYTRTLLETTFPVIYCSGVESDMIIYFLTNDIIKKNEDNKVIIYSTDTDFNQLLSDNVALLPWKKKLVTKDNWWQDKKIDSYINSKHYAICKSIVGDKSDNIKGIDNIGWKKIAKLFEIIYNEYGKDIDIDNVTDIINKLYSIQDKINDKKEKTFISNMLELLNANKELVNRNQKVIDLSMLETPYVYKIVSAINNMYDTPLKFNQKEFWSYLHLDRFKGEEEYEAILNKNSKNMYVLRNYIKKFNQSLEELKNKE